MSWILRKRDDGRCFGPLDTDTLRRWAWDGLVTPDDELSDDDGSVWIRAGSCSSVESFIAGQAQPLVLTTAELASQSARRRRRKGSLLDMTPLIDCVFLLLIFFFVATTFDAGSSPQAVGSEHGSDIVTLDVSIPRVDDRPDENSLAPLQVRVVVSEDGAIAVGGRAVDLASLASTIQSLKQDGREITAIVLADSEVKYGYIANVVAAIEAGGIERVLIGASGRD